ncbi:MAG: hypothetical protein K6E24_04075 [bacterium]|nr:hypothetical protein [bacterium]
MKGLRKNIYAITVIALFSIAFAMLVLFLALFSSSTAVDGTTVGSVYIGDQKPNTDGRKQKLTEGVLSWQKDARYTISFQNYNFVIGRTDKLDDEGNPMYDEEGNQLFNDEGLSFLKFDYAETNRLIKNDSSDNEAIFVLSDEKKEEFYQTLVLNFGKDAVDLRFFNFDGDGGLLQRIMQDAREMNTKCDYDLYDYLNDSWNVSEVSDISISNLTSAKVDFLCNIFADKEIVIAPQKSDEGKLGFSTIEFFSKEEFANEGLTSSDMSIIATGFAAVVQNSSLTVTVKNQGYISDRYYAFDDMTARVNVKDGTDLRIMNPETHEYIIIIQKGADGIDGTSSLRFILKGSKLVNKYTVVKNDNSIPFETVYDSNATDTSYDPTYMEADTYKGGCYSWAYQEGRDTNLYSFTKIVEYVDGTTAEIEIYPKQEFYNGRDELRHWTKNGYKA